MAFAITISLVIPISLLYGFLVTAIAGTAFSFAMGIAAFIFFQISGGRLGNGNYPMDLAALLIFIIAAFLLLIVVLCSVVVFFTGPFWLGSTTRERHKATSTANLGKISHLCESVAQEMGQHPFDYIVEVGGYYVGAISTFSGKTLLIDGRVLDYVSECEMKAMIAHEYGHFGKGKSFCYAFLRRCHLAATFVSTQINDDTEYSVFRKLLRWMLALVPQFFAMPKILQAIVLHISRIIARLYTLATDIVVRLFRTEFYRSEIHADDAASETVSQTDVCWALVRLSALQLCIVLSTRISPTQFLTRWQSITRNHTPTHPSIEYRLKRLGQVDLEQYSHWVQGLMSESTFSSIVQNDRKNSVSRDDWERTTLRLMGFSQVVNGGRV